MKATSEAAKSGLKQTKTVLDEHSAAKTEGARDVFRVNQLLSQK